MGLYRVLMINMVLYLVLMMTSQRQAGIHSILITIWNRYLEQVFGTGYVQANLGRNLRLNFYIKSHMTGLR